MRYGLVWPVNNDWMPERWGWCRANDATSPPGSSSRRGEWALPVLRHRPAGSGLPCKTIPWLTALFCGGIAPLPPARIWRTPLLPGATRGKQRLAHKGNRIGTTPPPVQRQRPGVCQRQCENFVAKAATHHLLTVAVMPCRVLDNPQSSHLSGDAPARLGRAPARGRRRSGCLEAVAVAGQAKNFFIERENQPPACLLLTRLFILSLTACT